MPTRPLRPCAEPRCPTLVEHGRCPKHQRAAQRQQADRRGTAHERGYTSQWQAASKAFLHDHPLCYYCNLLGRITPATSVDHATPPSGPTDPLFWDRDNWRSACIPCNSGKGDDDEAAFRARIEARQL